MILIDTIYINYGCGLEMHGAKPNEEILSAMRKHDIFLFTSDRFEGWRAVANEAMANGCVIVTFNSIGSTPYLVKNGINGLIFESENVESMTNKVEWLINNPLEKSKMRCEARRTMTDVWSPAKAASALLHLIEDLQHRQGCSIMEGPCSKA